LYFFFIIIFIPTRFNGCSFTAWVILNYASEKPNRGGRRASKYVKFCLEIIKEQLQFAELNGKNVDLVLLSSLVHDLQCLKFPESSLNTRAYNQTYLLKLIYNNYYELYKKVNPFFERGVFVCQDGTFFFKTVSGIKTDFVVQVPSGVYTHITENSSNFEDVEEEIKTSNDRFIALGHEMGELFPSLKVIRVLLEFAECEIIAKAKKKPLQKKKPSQKSSKKKIRV